jgi:hypothetical protein
MAGESIIWHDVWVSNALCLALGTSQRDSLKLYMKSNSFTEAGIETTWAGQAIEIYLDVEAQLKVAILQSEDRPWWLKNMGV